MKIAIYTDNFYPELSGLSDFVLLFSQILAEHGHSILLVAPYYSEREYTVAKLPYKEYPYQEAIKEKISVVRVPSMRYAAMPTGQARSVIPFGASFSAVRKFKPDIIHTNTPFGVGLEALAIAKILRIPIVGTNHTPPTEFVQYTPINTKWFGRLSLRYFVWYYNRCSYVTAPCASLLAEMKQYGFHKPNEVMPNPLDLSIFTPIKNAEEKEAARTEFGFSFPTLLYTGRLAEEKHIDVIIRAVARLKDKISALHFAISGHGNAEKKLRDLTRELGAEKHISFLGYVDDSRFPALYKASDLFVMMSTAESQSLSLMHAMSTGLPVIGANARALPEYIDAGSGVIVEPGDDKALADAIFAIISNAELAKKFGMGGIESVASYEKNVIAKRWENVFNKIVNIKNEKRKPKN